ncbi:hypothetical protein Tco_0550772 [Tanacetum coccineum]
MSYLVRAYFSISPTRYYKDDSCWSVDLKLNTTEDVISIGSFMEVLVLNHYVLVRKLFPTQGILDAEGIFLYNTPNKAFQILEDKNDNNKGDIKFIKVDETQPVPTMSNPNPIEANSLTVSSFLKDCTMHIPYTDVKTFADVVLLNQVGEKEFKSIVGDGIGVLTKKKIKKNDMGLSKESAME